MVTVKSYSDLQQSKKLAEILPLESADMYYECTKEKPEYKVYVGRNIAITYNLFSYRNGYTIPCWSLAALLGVIPKHIIDSNVLRIDINENSFAIWYDEIGCGVNNKLPNIETKEPINACVAMIEKLHKLKML